MNRAFRDTNCRPVKLVLPDRIELQQWRELTERLVTALELRFDSSPAEQALICEVHTKLRDGFTFADPPPPHPCELDEF